MRSASNFARRLGLLLAVVVAAIVAAGCPGPTFVVQQYSGPQRPQEAVGILRVNGNQPVRLLILDDQDVAAPIAEDGRLHIEMLPGRHTVVVANANAPNERYAPMSFQAEPGKVYRIGFVSGPSGSEPRIFEVDRGKDSVLRDVTQPPPSEPAPARRPPPETPAGPSEDAGVTSGDAG